MGWNGVGVVLEIQYCLFSLCFWFSPLRFVVVVVVVVLFFVVFLCCCYKCLLFCWLFLPCAVPLCLFLWSLLLVNLKALRSCSQKEPWWQHFHSFLSGLETVKGGPHPRSIFSKYIDTSLAIVSLIICCQTGRLCLDADTVNFPSCLRKAPPQICWSQDQLKVSELHPFWGYMRSRQSMYNCC